MTFPKSLTILPPATISSFSKFVSLFLFCKYLYLYHFFLGFPYKRYHVFLLSVWLGSFSMTLSRSFHGAAGMCVWAKSLQSCLTLCDAMDCSPPGSSVHGISQARILKWIVFCPFRGSFWPRNRTWGSCIGRWILYHWATQEAHTYAYIHKNICVHMYICVNIYICVWVYVCELLLPGKPYNKTIIIAILMWGRKLIIKQNLICATEFLKNLIQLHVR